MGATKAGKIRTSLLNVKPRPHVAVFVFRRFGQRSGKNSRVKRVRLQKRSLNLRFYLKHDILLYLFGWRIMFFHLFEWSAL